MSADVVLSSGRGRLARFPRFLTECVAEAGLYGKCVAATTTGKVELQKDVCAREFEALKNCFTKAGKKILK